MATPQRVPLQRTLVGGKYQLGEVIGSGGVGTVYRAKHLWTEREVAVKVLDPNLEHFDQLREAFLREARATVQLEHPNVVDVLDMGEDDFGTTYMVMELLDGPTLRDVLLEQGRLSERDTASILLPLVDALEKAHELGIVHKDFKPENIILSIDASDAMTPKLLDFGVAQLVRESRPQRTTTAREVIVGTPQYMSPEQARDQRQLIGPQTDVWGVGVVWYECLTGRCAFDADTALDVLTAVCEAPVDYDGISADLTSVLQKAMERPVTMRTPNLGTLRAELERATVFESAAAEDPTLPSFRSTGSERPSYVRRTLQGVGPSRAAVTKERPVQLDSELLTLPAASHRKLVIGGLALAVAVGLAAWWTIDGSAPGAPESSAPAVISEIAPLEPAAADPIEPRAGAPEPSVVEPVEPDPPVERSEPVPLPAAAGLVPDPPPTAPTVSTPRNDGRRTRERDRPPSGPAYDKPPELVTEW